MLMLAGADPQRQLWTEGKERLVQPNGARGVFEFMFDQFFFTTFLYLAALLQLRGHLFLLYLMMKTRPEFPEDPSSSSSLFPV
jgi:hypothetical protein